jgi:hypothetical protein
MTTTINASTSSGLVNTADTSGILQLQTASTAAVTITAAQLVGIGTASPTVQLLNIAATSISGPTNNPAGVQLTDSGASLSSQIVNRSGNTLHNVPSTKAHSFQVNSTETVTLNTYGVGLGGTTPTSGMGIAFPATQSASSDANTLDDYEEGTFTPGVAFGGGTTGITYSTQVGQYVKIGRFVYATFNIALTNKGSSSGSVTVTGLPFSISGTVSYGICIANTFSLNSTIQTVLQMTNGGTVMDIKQSGTDNNIGNTDFTNSTQVRATVVYTSA